jgi:hypothetical protein
MNAANPLWGSPRIHGELLKLGIEIRQATVAKYMVRRRGTPSPTWRSFLRNQAAGIAAIDMFVVASASFRLLYVMIILAHDRRRIIHTAFTDEWMRRRHGTTLTLAERFRRACDRFDSSRMPGSHRDFQRAPSAPGPVLVCRLLPKHPYPSFTRQGLPGSPSGYATQDWKSCRHPASQGPASPLRTARRLIRNNSSPAIAPQPIRRRLRSLCGRSFDLNQEADRMSFRSEADSLLAAIH